MNLKYLKEWNIEIKNDIKNNDKNDIWWWLILTVFQKNSNIIDTRYVTSN